MERDQRVDWTPEQIRALNEAVLRDMGIDDNDLLEANLDAERGDLGDQERANDMQVK